MARIVALIVVAALAAAPAAAVAAAQQEAPAQSLLQNTPQEAPATQPQQAPPSTTTTAENGAITGLQVLLIALAVVALIGGIWVVIARDAKRATAGRVRSSDAGLVGRRGGSPTRAGRRSRKLSGEERRRRKRGRAAK